MAFTIPEGLDENLYGLAWMIGRWEGAGKGTSPTEGDFEYGQTLDIAHNGGPYLHYLSQLFELDEHGDAIRTRSMESGFWKADGKGGLEVVMCHPEGYAEVWYGHIDGAKIELVTDGVMRTQNAATPYTGGQRLYGNVEGDLLWTYDRATENTPLQPYLWARLHRGDLAPVVDEPTA